MKRTFDNYDAFQRWHRYNKISVLDNILYSCNNEYAGEYEVDKKGVVIHVTALRKHIPQREIDYGLWS